MQHWINFLPEVGAPLERDAERLTEMYQKIERLNNQAQELEAKAFEYAITAWTKKEIDDAKEKAKTTQIFFFVIDGRWLSLIHFVRHWKTQIM